MRLKIDLEIPNWTKWLVGGVAIGVVLGIGAARVYAETVSVPKTWAAGNPLNAADLNDNFKTLQDAFNRLAQPGIISAYGGPVVPTGWLLCDGSAVSRTTYAGLFTAIGTVHGSGDGASTFNLPDYRGRFLRGVDGAAGNDPDAATRTAAKTGGNVGNMLGSLQGQATALPTLQFGISTTGGHNHYLGGASDASVVSGHLTSSATTGTWTLSDTGPYGGSNTTTSGDHSHAVSGGDKETRPKNAYVNYIIKY